MVRSQPDSSYPFTGNRLLSFLYERDSGRCRLCGVSLIKEHFTVDYIIPISRGGSNHEGNMQLSCDPCRLRKGKRTLDEYANWLSANDLEAYRRLISAQDRGQRTRRRSWWHFW